MTDATDLSVPAPAERLPHGTGKRPIDAVLDYARAGDGAMAAKRARALAARPPAPRRLFEVLEAAIALGDENFIRAAVDLMITVDVPAHIRVISAARLAQSKRIDAAMGVFLADPNILNRNGMPPSAINALTIICTNAAPGSIVRLQAETLKRRMLSLAEPAIVKTHRSFAQSDLQQPMTRGPSTELHATPRVSKAIIQETEDFLGKYDTKIRTYRYPDINIIEDVFINRFGQIWDSDGRVFESTLKFIPDSSKSAQKLCATVDEAVMAVDTHDNIYHWLAEWIPSCAWRLDDALSTIPFIIRDDAPPFVTESLRLASAAPPPLVEVGDAVRVRRLFVTKRDMVMLSLRDVADNVMKRIRDRALEAVSPTTSTSVYVSRRDSRRRILQNEAALEEALRQRGFEILVMSELPFVEQVARLSTAEVVASPHGAGLALLAAAPPGRRVMEIVPCRPGIMNMRTCMARISRIIGHQHLLWLEPVQPDGSWSVDLEPFLSTLDAMREASH